MSSNNLITCSSPKEYIMYFNITLANEVSVDTLNAFLQTSFLSYLQNEINPFNQMITRQFIFNVLMPTNNITVINGQYQYTFMIFFTYPSLIPTQNAVIPTGGWQFNFYVDNTQGQDNIDPTKTAQVIYLFSDLQTLATKYNSNNHTNIVITNLQQVQQMTWWQALLNFFFGWLGPVQQWIDTWGLAVLILVLLISFLILLAIIKFVLS